MKIKVELVKYDTEKPKKRKRANLLVEAKSEEAVIEKLEKIHKGDKVKSIHEIVWGENQTNEKDQAAIITGTVKFFDEEKGFGFISPDADMEDLFFHASALGGETIYDDDFVQFQASQGPKGMIAIHIKLANQDEK